MPRGRYWRSNLSCWCFHLTRAASDNRFTEIAVDFGGQCQALMIGELIASVPGQRSGKFAGQSLRLLDERGDDAFGILVRDHRTIFNRCRSFSDRFGILNPL